MFQFRRFPSYAYFVQRRMTGYCPAGLPHSEIPGSMDICSSPRLFAACHVLLRLLMPRHSPCALSSLTIVEETRSIPFPPLGENFISAPSFSSFRQKLVFGEGDGSYGFEPFDLSENSWFSLRIMQALQRSKLYVTLHPFECCSTINLLRRVSPHNASLLPYLLCHIVQFSRCRSSKETSLHLLRLSAKLAPFRSFSFSHFKHVVGLKWEPSNRFCSQI